MWSLEDSRNIRVVSPRLRRHQSSLQRSKKSFRLGDTVTELLCLEDPNCVHTHIHTHTDMSYLCYIRGFRRIAYLYVQPRTRIHPVKPLLRGFTFSFPLSFYMGNEENYDSQSLVPLYLTFRTWRDEGDTSRLYLVLLRPWMFNVGTRPRCLSGLPTQWGFPTRRVHLKSRPDSCFWLVGGRSTSSIVHTRLPTTSLNQGTDYRRWGRVSVSYIKKLQFNRRNCVSERQPLTRRRSL